MRFNASNAFNDEEEKKGGNVADFLQSEEWILWMTTNGIKKSTETAATFSFLYAKWVFIYSVASTRIRHMFCIISRFFLFLSWARKYLLPLVL